MSDSISALLGKTLVSAQNINDESIRFETEGGVYELYHEADCCEHVYVESITGDLVDLVGSPLLVAEEISGENLFGKYAPWTLESPEESFTWTFYKLATIKGSVTIRFYGSSNGHYSESVEFRKVA